jgi:hypothetical protein
MTFEQRAREWMAMADQAFSGVAKEIQETRAKIATLEKEVEYLKNELAKDFDDRGKTL